MLSTKLLHFDLFGSNINFYYRGMEKFHTTWGCIVTFIIVLTYLAMVSVKCIEFFGETDGIDHFSETYQSINESIDLMKLGFSFAVENVDQTMGKLEAFQVRWSGIDGSK